VPLRRVNAGLPDPTQTEGTEALMADEGISDVAAAALLARARRPARDRRGGDIPGVAARELYAIGATLVTDRGRTAV
jgi:hypothetical protein